MGRYCKGIGRPLILRKQCEAYTIQNVQYMHCVMNDVEKRRLRLLQETRKNYSDKYVPPAVHPRYRSTYDSLYRDYDGDESINHGTFFMRTVIALLLFGLFFVMDNRKEQIGTVNSQMIISEVQRNLLSE